ncbi:UDP-glucosyltransferase 2-like [Colletes gigas]|uniref:UDP-glucosyltransferase 2-like n=1 Tax=Colletes gigas TaxID=935657 RepID=UPI001C9B76D5|nr:UDP-glucosyltransferase 2-like [Colletes gigas]XP_043264521.1 UDP-glucosyltransferase 2-like [Colletes gigas]XP_043264522.1 UDP-glucosyltransferase 2-like [Colletes gigas]XP_043264523.1 UDP-glucosyltransferase 2-like [Colletes gigas]XP_043264524.1 UDP-glucosyltransferase 2-like [Colletes gigas]
MRHLKILFFLVFAVSIQQIEGYRILCLFPYSGQSHQRMFETLCKGLATKGHQIDMISHFPSKTPVANYTDVVDLRGTTKSVVNSLSIETAKKFRDPVIYYLTKDFGAPVCDLMGSEVFQNFISNPPNDPPYDLIITEYFGSPCYLGVGYRLKTPVAIAVSFLDMPFVDDFMGSPISYAFFSGGFNEKTVINTFYDRLTNFLQSFVDLNKFYYYSSSHTEIMRKYLGQDVPDVRELEKSVVLALVNGHYSITGVRPLTPGIVDVGGLHVLSDNSTLTPALKSWLDSAEHGVVYFTLGSLIKIETLPKDRVLGLYASFAKIAPVKILMKSTNTTRLPPGLPSNVMTLPWIPQVPVLSHKNTRAFITHGGLMGLQEALYYGVPLIGIPVFADQMRNIDILMNKNVAAKINDDEINERTMDAALNAVLYDPKYKESATRLSKVFRDRPLSPMDTATYWIEYVIRNGVEPLRSPAMDLPWWKLHLLDVLAFLALCSSLGVYLLIVLLKIVLKKLQNDDAKSTKKFN